MMSPLLKLSASQFGRGNCWQWKLLAEQKLRDERRGEGSLEMRMCAKHLIQTIFRKVGSVCRIGDTQIALL